MPTLISHILSVSRATPLITAGMLALQPLAAEAQAGPTPSFLDLCEGRNNAARWYTFEMSDHAYETLEALLETVGTRDCREAQQRLQGVTDLRLPELAATAMPLTCILVDLPTVVDLKVIAIATPHLTRLDLSGKVIMDLAPISALTQLEELYLTNTHITDLSPLIGLPLTTLDVSYNRIESIEPIAELSAVRALDISNNPITDISPLGAILTPYNQSEWDYLILSGLNYRLDTCPIALSDACEGDIYAD